MLLRDSKIFGGNVKAQMSNDKGRFLMKGNVKAQMSNY